MSQMMFDSPTADGGGVHFKAEAAMRFGGGKPIGCGRFGRKEFAQERLDARGPMRSVIPPGNAGRPDKLLAAGNGTKVIRVKQIETGAAQCEGLRGGAGGDFAPAKRSQDFADQRSAEAVRELAIMLFITWKMTETSARGECGVLALRAFRRPALRFGLLQARRANGVHLCSHTCPRLNAHCPPLLATQHHGFATGGAFPGGV